MTTATQIPDWYWKTFDTAPPIVCQLAAGTVDLTGSTVKFSMTAVGSNTPKVSLAAGVVTDGPNGIVSYSPTSANTNAPGDFNAEFEITYPSGKKQTFPDPGYLLVRITADLDGS